MRKKLFLSFVDALTVKTSLTDKALEILCLIYKESPCVDIEDFVTPTKTGACNTVTNLEHRAEAIYRAADLEELGGSLHVLRRTLATDMYDNGAPIKQIASYIGDSEATTEKYYIAVRKKDYFRGEGDADCTSTCSKADTENIIGQPLRK